MGRFNQNFEIKVGKIGALSFAILSVSMVGYIVYVPGRKNRNIRTLERGLSKKKTKIL